MLLAFLLLPVGCGNLFSQIPSATPQTLSTSPDGKFLVRRSQADPGEHGETRKNLEICSASGTVLYSWGSGLGYSTVFWSPDSRYLALNDMPGEQGDLVRIFALDAAKQTVSSIREPNGKKVLKEEDARHGSFLSTIDKVNLRAVEWRDGNLWCELTGSAHPKREPMVHVPFHHLWVLGMKGEELPIFLEEWTRTSPGEYPVRDR